MKTTPPSPPAPAGTGETGSILPVTGLAPSVQRPQDEVLRLLSQHRLPACPLCGVRHPPPYQRPRGGPGLGD